MSQLAELQDAKNQALVGEAISKAVMLSFAADETAQRHQTQDEIKRRTHVCLDFFKIMRNELRWSISKICDLMPRLLIAELSGGGMDYLQEMQDRGWVTVERQTPGGIILPN